MGGIDTTEALGFNRRDFPLSYKGHTLFLMRNYLYVNDESRLRAHVTIHCSTCKANRTIRGTFPREYTSHNRLSALTKVAVLSLFSQECA